MAISKFWLDVFQEMVGAEEVLVALQQLSTIKKGLKPLQFPIEWALFRSFYDNFFDTKCPALKEKINK